MTIHKTARARLGLETLEQRWTPAVNLDGGNIYIFGTAEDDTATVEYIISGGPIGPYYRVKFNGAVSIFDADLVTAGTVCFYGGNGDDYFKNANDKLRVIAVGEAGSDTLIGGGRNDLMSGGAANGADTDTLMGMGGDDWLGGGSNVGNKLYGGEGKDRLDGTQGNDFLYGEDGRDELYGYGGNDFLDGGAGWYDLLQGGADNDIFVLDKDWEDGIWFNKDAPVDFNAADDIIW